MHRYEIFLCPHPLLHATNGRMPAIEAIDSTCTGRLVQDKADAHLSCAVSSDRIEVHATSSTSITEDMLDVLSLRETQAISTIRFSLKR